MVIDLLPASTHFLIKKSAASLKRCMRSLSWPTAVTRADMILYLALNDPNHVRPQYQQIFPCVLPFLGG